MKKIKQNALKYMFLCLVIISQQVKGQTGIVFESGSWNQLLSKAKKEKKIIFLDAFATWCGPCKYMSANIFTNSEVGTFFNKNFINAKIDMEHGEGKELAKRYDVEVYPTLLFIDGNGKLLHKALGSQSNTEFIEIGRNALNPEMQLYPLREKFGKQPLTANQLMELTKKASILGESSEKFAIEYLKLNKKWMQADVLEFMFEYTSPAYTEGFNYLIANEAQIMKLLGADAAKKYYNKMFIDYATYQADNENDIEKSVAIFKTAYNKYRPGLPSIEAEALQYGYNRAKEDNDLIHCNKYLIEYIDLIMPTMGSDGLNSLAWNVYQSISAESNLSLSNIDLLNAAVKWCLKSINIESTYLNNNTLAHLYHKLGDKKSAKKYAKIALSMGKKSGDDVSITKELLDKL